MKQQLEHLKLTLGENPCDGLALLTLGDMLFHGKVDVQEHLTILEELQELLFAAHQPNGDPTKINTTLSAVDCLKYAVIADVDDMNSWHTLGLYMQETSNLEQNSTQFDPRGDGSDVTAFTRLDCFVEALRCDGSDVGSWRELLNTMVQCNMESVEAAGKVRSQADIANILESNSDEAVNRLFGFSDDE